ncbi:hypothetical protein GH714_009170 [Hevea brasiliensis]|uniref:DEAD-box ATP-dependent RNA helicase 48 n=1 Tax=Hevea brasiliensis TaxID=3981 RepID=A0A6A6KI86_HEVBR|nr:hypothetical protein GH714_009170 [Hevea brasiliensis]
MGGGPRTYPGGVSKWQWKRMQAKKAKQLLKARLCRERQIYEMRKRAELKAAVSELERPWEKPGGFDMWSERDGPQLFETPDGIPSARFFPKGVVHSVRPYGKIAGNGDFDSGEEDSAMESESERENENGNKDRYGMAMARNGYKSNALSVNEKFRRGGLHTGRKKDCVDSLAREDNSDLESGYNKNSTGKWGMDKNTKSRNGGEFRKQGNRSRFRSGLGSLDSGQVGLGRKQRGSGDTKTNRSKIDGRNRSNGSNSLRNPRYSKSEVCDMSLQQDGSYGFQAKSRQIDSNFQAPEVFESF